MNEMIRRSWVIDLHLTFIFLSYYFENECRAYAEPKESRGVNPGFSRCLSLVVAPKPRELAEMRQGAGFPYSTEDDYFIAQEWACCAIMGKIG